MNRKILALLLSTVMLFSMFSFAGCSGKDTVADDTTAAVTTAADTTPSYKVGVILVGDESEGYTLAHIDGIKEAAEELGISDNIIWKYSVPETDEVSTAADALVAAGCTLIISNSYGHQDYMAESADTYPNVSFVAMTGDFAAISGLDNLYNAFTDVYEARYISGVIAGMKLAELKEDNKLKEDNFDADGNIKIGYVGAYNYAEVISGYTSFYLGVKSVVENVVMDVYYTSSWFDYDGEGAAAELLLKKGCVIIGQHADSAGAPTMIQSYLDKGTVCYSVGYNVDMLDSAPTAALTSATNNWDVYYKALFTAFAADDMASVADWAEGFSKDAVGITELGASCAEGTADAIADIEASLADGTLHVFDVSKFTVDGKAITSNKVNMSYMDWSTMTAIYEGEEVETVKTDAAGVSYIDESSFRSAPYFSLIIDGITELNTPS